jgi:glyoxylase-like metal-dependent hydrolase (beta-lactamase superfamily II)
VGGEELLGGHRVAAVRYGTRVCRRSEAFFRYDRYGESDGDADFRLDYFFWIILSGSEVILMDTGFDDVVGVRRGRTVVVPALEGLRRAGVEPEQVSKILLSHMHYDHTGNLKAFPHAEIIVQKRELDFWKSPYCSKTHFVHEMEPVDLELIFEAERSGRLYTVDGDATVAPGIAVKLMVGHTVGLQMVVVERAAGPVILAADSVHHYEEMEKERPFSVFSDLVGMYRNFDTIRAMLADRPGTLVPGHDPEVTRRFPTIQGDNAGLIFLLD